MPKAPLPVVSVVAVKDDSPDIATAVVFGVIATESPVDVMRTATRPLLLLVSVARIVATLDHGRALDVSHVSKSSLNARSVFASESIVST